MSSDEPIIVTEYDPTWPMLFAAERNRVRNACGQAVTRIEHIGSTAVSGMAAKPIVDLLVGVRTLEGIAQYAEKLAAIGYRSVGAALYADRIYLRRRGPPHFDIAVAVDGGDWWRAQIGLRDYLRARPAEAAAYSNCKRDIFRAGSRTFASYAKDRAPFLKALSERARIWSRT
jgi:GrpB-like predicted nucleotidyltransferase (UPF0157 family)